MLDEKKAILNTLDEIDSDSFFVDTIYLNFKKCMLSSLKFKLETHYS